MDIHEFQGEEIWVCTPAEARQMWKDHPADRHRLWSIEESWRHCLDTPRQLAEVVEKKRQRPGEY